MKNLDTDDAESAEAEIRAAIRRMRRACTSSSA
jgi:hypothetical protein